MSNVMDSVPLREFLKQEKYDRRKAYAVLRDYLLHHGIEKGGQRDGVYEQIAKLSDSEVAIEAAKAYDDAPELYKKFVETIEEQNALLRNVLELTEVHPYFTEAMRLCNGDFVDAYKLVMSYLAELLCRKAGPPSTKEGLMEFLLAREDPESQSELLVLLYGFWAKNPGLFEVGLRLEAQKMGFTTVTVNSGSSKAARKKKRHAYQH